MLELIIKSFGYIILIVFGYILKKLNIFSNKDKDVLGKLLLYIMLPCAFISNFKDFNKSDGMIYLVIIGFLSNIIMISIGYFFTHKRNESYKSLYMIECSGYNIGAFTIPFVNCFLPKEAVIIASLFDIGNCIMSVGWIYPLAKGVNKKNDLFNSVVNNFIQKLFKSIPFDTYIFMLLISLVNIKLPSAVNDIASMIGSPSIIITMIMIGITFEINISKEDIIDIFKILTVRYFFGFVIALIVWNLFDFTYLARKVIIICLMAPVTSISASYCNLCKCKSEVYGAVSSLTVPISLIIFIILIDIL